MIKVTIAATFLNAALFTTAQPSHAQAGPFIFQPHSELQRVDPAKVLALISRIKGSGGSIEIPAQ